MHKHEYISEMQALLYSSYSTNQYHASHLIRLTSKRLPDYIFHLNKAPQCRLFSETKKKKTRGVFLCVNTFFLVYNNTALKDLIQFEKL